MLQVVSSLLYRNLTVVYLWCVGWLEVKRMMVSVNVGFLNMEVFMFVGVLRMDMSRKFKMWSFPVSAVNCSFGCRELKLSRIFCMLEWMESNISKISSTYLQ